MALLPKEFASLPLFSDANLLSYYKCENANDSKGSNNLSNNGSPTFAAGLFNNALTLTPNAGLVWSTANPFVTGTNDIAFSVWAKISTQPSNADMTPIQWGNATRPIYIIYNDASGVKSVQIGDGNAMFVSIAQALNTGEWYHMALSFKASTTEWKMWLNAQLLLQGTSASPAPNFNSFSLGYLAGAGNRFWNGQIDDCAVFNRQLTQADVDMIYNTSKVGSMAIMFK